MKKSLAERFVEKTHRDPVTGCLLWTGAIDSSGYGSLGFQGKVVGAHRVAFFLVHGRWPTPCALHRCDTPACVDVTHIFEGTNADNSADAVAKGRARGGSGKRHWSHLYPEMRLRGERNHRAKLTEAQVIQIRSMPGTRREVAAIFGVSSSTIKKVRTGSTWAKSPHPET